METVKKVGETVRVNGWVHRTRRLGKIVFIDLRDRTGILQVVFDPAAVPEAKDLRPEFVVEIEGTVVERKGKNANPKEPMGTVELQGAALKILNTAETPPFEIENEDRQASEELRMKYRYLDLRHARMQHNLRLRHAVVAFIRQFLGEKGFIEVETPYITKGTPEGAREYLIPSRLYPGKFYVLPQSPQQFKQLLMVGGIERYFQIARCFRDEDTRGDRQPEFTQMDLEMSFVDVEDVLHLTEELFIVLVETITPDKKLTFKPFKRLTHQESMDQYGTDKPDLRKDKNDLNELAFAFITHFPMFEYSETEKKLVPVHHLFTAPKDEDIALLDTAPEKARSKQYDLVLNGVELAGGSIRIHEQELQRKIFKILKFSDEEAERRFGHLLEAFRYGAPPHGGIAPGIDRLLMILCGEPSIREVIAFPKTSDGRDLLMGAPSSLPASQIREAHIRSIKE